MCATAAAAATGALIVAAAVALCAAPCILAVAEDERMSNEIQGLDVVPPVDIHIRKPHQDHAAKTFKRRHHRLRGHQGETEINRPVVLNVDDRGGLLEDRDERS